MRLPIPQILNGLDKRCRWQNSKWSVYVSSEDPHLFQSLSHWRPDAPLRLLDRVQPWLPGSHDYGGCCNHWQDCDLSLFQNEEMKGKRGNGMNEKWMTTTEREQEIVRRIKEIRCLSCLCFWAFSLLIPQWSISLLNCCSSVTDSCRKGGVGPKLDRVASHGLGIQPTPSNHQPVVRQIKSMD